MKNLFEDGASHEIKNRIQQLQAQMPAQWGKMNVSQMLAHCIKPMELGLGEVAAPQASFFKKVFGRLIKGVITSPKPYKPNLPTDPSFVTLNESPEFEEAKKALLSILDRYVANQDRVADIPHPLFGKLTKEECAFSQYKHLNHHLMQFGV